MSNRLFQGVIHQMRDAIDRTIGVIDETSVIIACSELGRIGEVNESITPDVKRAQHLCNQRLYLQILWQPASSGVRCFCSG